MSSSYFTFLNFKKNIRINIFITIQYFKHFYLSRAQTSCYGAQGRIKADIHESSVGASAPHRGTVFRWRIHECKSGRSQCWCASSSAGASKAANQCSSCHDFASERSQVVTVCQCSVKLHSNVGRCSLAGQSSTTDVHVQFTFCLSVVQVKCCRHCFGFT